MKKEILKSTIGKDDDNKTNRNVQTKGFKS